MMKKLLFLTAFTIISFYTSAQDQIIYTNSNEYVDSIIGVTKDTLVYSNYKNIHKVPISRIKAYYITVRKEENLKKSFYKRDREYFDLTEEFNKNLEKRRKARKDTVIYRRNVIKTSNPYRGKGFYDINFAFERFNDKRGSLNLNLKISFLNDLDISFKNDGIVFSPDKEISYGIDASGVALAASYRFYFIPFRKFRPGGIYIGLALQPMYTKAYCDTKYYENDIMQYFYREEATSIGVNLGTVAGVQWLIASRICLDFNLSVYGSISKFSSEQTVYYNSGYELEEIFDKNTVPVFFSINLGYAFN